MVLNLWCRGLTIQSARKVSVSHKINRLREYAGGIKGAGIEMEDTAYINECGIGWLMPSQLNKVLRP